MRIIGDVHGRIHEYLALNTESDESIQIGDVGFGFKAVSLPTMPPGHRFFRGNHDGPVLCHARPSSLGDWGYDEANGLFWFSGADSIDKHLRREGVSWWRDEELSVAEFERALELYEQVKPRVVLSHDGPQDFIRAAFGIHKKSRTRQALQAAYDLHQPDLWIYGHHHVRREFQSPEGTLFMCLPELGFIDLDLPLSLSDNGEAALGPFRTEETEAIERQELLGRVSAAVGDAAGLQGSRSTLFARVCLGNGGKLSKTKRERHFADLTDEQVGMAEGALKGTSTVDQADC